MNADDQASLHDVYELFHKESAVEQTGYIMQFLWTDLTSSYDIVGPYYTSSDTFNAKVIHSCVFETIELFQVNVTNHNNLCKCLFCFRYMDLLPVCWCAMVLHLI